MNKNEKVVSLVQGIYFLITGIWPLVHIESFMAVTGPKNDLWLVRTVGALITVIAVILLIAGLKNKVNWSVRLLAVLSAAGLATIDIYYTAINVISPVYLLDALAEIIIIIWWLYQYVKAKNSSWI